MNILLIPYHDFLAYSSGSVTIYSADKSTVIAGRIPKPSKPALLLEYSTSLFICYNARCCRYMIQHIISLLLLSLNRSG